MTIAILAARLIKVFEGCKLSAYWDATGRVWTIGFGHTKTAVRGMKITQQQAEELFQSDAAPLLAIVVDKPILEAAALVSFGYNCGIGALHRLLAGEISIDTYGTTSGGVTLPGLVSRRQLEAALIEVSKHNVG